MEKKEKFFSTRNVVYLAILTALLVVLNLLSNVFKIITNVNLTLIPIVLASLLLGYRGGLILGFISGLMTYLFGAFGVDPFTNVLFINHPVITFFVCVLKTSLAGLFAGIVYNLIKPKNQYVAIFVASGLAPIINTGLFILGALTMYNTIAREFSENVIYFLVIVCAGVNFLIEFAINLIVAPAISTVVKVLDKNV